MKKIFILVIAFCMLLSLNANAGTFSGANANNFTPKSEISDNKNTRKIKTIQKLLNTKIGKKIEKFIIKKTLKKLQKQALNPQKNKGDGLFTLGIVLFVLGVLSLLTGIVLIIAGSTLLGIILVIVGLLLLGIIMFFLSLLANAFRH